MNTENVNCRRIPYPLPAGTVISPGDFSWGPEHNGRRRLYICLPGEKNLDAIRVVRGSTNEERCWGWDGNEEQPTLDPSIDYPGHWHGFLRSGRLESV